LQVIPRGPPRAREASRTRRREAAPHNSRDRRRRVFLPASRASR